MKLIQINVRQGNALCCHACLIPPVWSPLEPQCKQAAACTAEGCHAKTGEANDILEKTRILNLLILQHWIWMHCQNFFFFFFFLSSNVLSFTLHQTLCLDLKILNLTCKSPDCSHAGLGRHQYWPGKERNKLSFLLQLEERLLSL